MYIYIYIYVCVCVCAGPTNDLFTIKLHHDGEFRSERSKYVYMGSQSTYIDYCEFNIMSLVELSTMATELGYCGSFKFFFGNELRGIFNSK